jgi:phosphoglycerol transferase MdoB-like AlkP superfamily enzyme
MYRFAKGRMRIVSLAFSSFVILSFLLRAFFLLWVRNEIDTDYTGIVEIFARGFLYDIVTALYLLSPLLLYLLLVPRKIYNGKVHRIILTLILYSFIYSILFSLVSEYFFWEEFGKRFNFIAVDYLVYTHEVVKNIWESYPVATIMFLLALLSALMTYLIFSKAIQERDEGTFAERTLRSLPLIVAIVLTLFFVDGESMLPESSNVYEKELAKNGIYSLFHAFRHNELDYESFYATLPHEKLFRNLAKLEGFDDKRAKQFISSNPKRKKNIIVVMIESMSAKYMGIYGNDKKLTPNLDRLAKESLFFDNLFATGTRTVRGMEALILSVPPTPGRSIVKRPRNDTMDSFGKVLAKEGYLENFIYAGYGYFDNMNDFFSKNGFNIVDRKDFASEEISFSNVWGVCDEDLFKKVLKVADRAYASHRHFFNYIMTTSNHRPYTYPAGKIDIESGSGRDGAVKYCDYSIGRFIQEARKRAWFKDTVFVFVADHNGGSAGKTSLPLNRYKIPLIIYSPSLIKPRRVSKLSSQIDTLPTLLDILGIDFKGKFYGRSIIEDSFRPRAFIGNYQKLGLVEGGALYYLTPDKKVHKKIIESLSLNRVRYGDANMSQIERETLISYYQSASVIYHESLKRGKIDQKVY